MTKVPTCPPGGDSPPGGREQQKITNAAIRAGVMRSLGRPGDLFGVTVRPLWERYYRVNVWTGADATSARVAHSYFVRADDGGEIVTTVPRITRQYP